MNRQELTRVDKSCKNQQEWTRINQNLQKYTGINNDYQKSTGIDKNQEE